MLPTLATPKQIRSGKIRKHLTSCMDCFPKLCSCPPTPEDVIQAIECYLDDCKNILTDREKERCRKDIEEAMRIQKRYEEIMK